MIKTDFHLHAREDKRDAVDHSATELIDLLVEKGYGAMSLTFHDQYYIDKKTSEHAKKKGIVLIPGIERTIEGAHILILNAKEEEVKSLKKLEDLKKIRRKDTLIIAAHPGFKHNSLGARRLKENIELFDAVEYCHFYLPWWNMNKNIKKIADHYKKPMVGNSDTHYLYQVGHTYSLVDAEKDIQSILNAIKKGNVEVKTEPLPFSTFLRISVNMFLLLPFKSWKRRRKPF